MTQLDDHLIREVGLYPLFMMAGNYARAFMDQENLTTISSLLASTKRRRS